MLVKLTNLLAADALELAGMGDVGAVLVLPLATGWWNLSAEAVLGSA